MKGISVSGTGTAAGAPDLAFISLGVEVMARSVAEARDAAASNAAAVLSALRSQGLEAADLTTTALSIHPEYDHREGRRLRGYRVTNGVEVKVRSVETVGDVIDAAVAAGGDTTVVHGVHFAHEDSEHLGASARDAAWEDAMGKAAQLASLSGVTLGQVVSITEQTHGPPIGLVRSMSREAAPATPVEPGLLGVTVTIEVQFAID